MTNAAIQNKLVIVDDEKMVVTSIKNYLMLETDYEILPFTSPEEALAEIKENPVSLVISDFLMPEMNGIEFLKKVKEINPNATTILLTGYADKENAIKAINDVGIYKYIEKPWDNEDLKITIDNAFERSTLINALETKLNELAEAKKKLEQYNNKLEILVEERTQELAFINAELNTIIESSAEGIFTLDDSLTITSASSALENLKGQPKNEIIGQPLRDIFGFSKEAKKIFDEKITSACIYTDCWLINTTLEKKIPVELSVSPIKADQEHSEHSFVVVARDISAQKETERLREDFIATLTHDLRTPLLAAIQTLNFFIDGTLGELTEKQIKLLETMRTSNKDMLGLVNALLEVYKYEAGNLILVKDDIDLLKLIDTCCEEVKSLFEKKNLTLKKDIPAKDVLIYADRKELRRVLANFIGNAINYTLSGGEVTIKLLETTDSVTVSVTDTGRGIPEADIKRLFNRFSQGTSKQRSTGTGLGLYLSRQIIEAHDGKIWATSTVNVGSTFSFSIPRDNK